MNALDITDPSNSLALCSAISSKGFPTSNSIRAAAWVFIAALLAAKQKGLVDLPLVILNVLPSDKKMRWNAERFQEFGKTLADDATYPCMLTVLGELPSAFGDTAHDGYYDPMLVAWLVVQVGGQKNLVRTVPHMQLRQLILMRLCMFVYFLFLVVHRSPSSPLASA